MLYHIKIVQYHIVHYMYLYQLRDLGILTFSIWLKNRFDTYFLFNDLPSIYNRAVYHTSFEIKQSDW